MLRLNCSLWNLSFRQYLVFVLAARLTFAAVDDLVGELARQLGALLEQRPVVAVEVDPGQTADEPGARADVPAEPRQWPRDAAARRQATDEQLVADVEVDRVLLLLLLVAP